MKKLLHHWLIKKRALTLPHWGLEVDCLLLALTTPRPTIHVPSVRQTSTDSHLHPRRPSECCWKRKSAFSLVCKFPATKRIQQHRSICRMFVSRSQNIKSPLWQSNLIRSLIWNDDCDDDEKSLNSFLYGTKRLISLDGRVVKGQYTH